LSISSSSQKEKLNKNNFFARIDKKINYSKSKSPQQKENLKINKN
jgi:hypothetical protein